MSNLTEKALWEPGIYQLETSDQVIGGPDGIDNLQAKQLGNRTLYLKKVAEDHASAKDPHSQYAPKESPTLTGTPKAPKAARGTNTEQIATTGFVLDNAVPYRGLVPTDADLNTLLDNGYYVQNLSANAKTTLNYPLNSAGMLRVVRYDVMTYQEYHAHLNTGVYHRTYYNGAWQPWRVLAFNESPVFTGVPAAPTAAPGTNSAQIATTSFVQNLGTLRANQVRNVPPSAIAKATLSSHFVSRTGVETGGVGLDYGDFLTLNSYADTTGGNLNALLFTKISGNAQAIFHYRANPADATWGAPKQLAYTDSPDLVGTPTAPTPAQDTNTRQLATTAFVLGQGATALPRMDGAAAVGVSRRYAREDHVHATDSTRAPLASPDFSGKPTAPTAAAGTNTTQIASTAFVLENAMPNRGMIPAGTNLNTVTETGVYIQNTAGNAALALNYPVAYAGLLTVYTHLNETFQTYQELLTRGMWYRTRYNNDWDAWKKAAYTESPDFTGTPTAPTAATGSNSKQVATTAFVANSIAALVASAPGTLDTLRELADALGNDPNFATTMTKALAAKAPLASPDLTGKPTAPTAPADTGTTQLATTAFVLGQGAGVLPKMDGVPAVGVSKRYAREDHAHASDTSRAPLASPEFTGEPTAPTAPQFDNSKRLATTEWASSQGQRFAGVLKIVASGALTAKDHAGRFLHLASASAMTLTLPLASTVPPGIIIAAQNLGAPATFARQGNDFISVNGSNLTGISLLAGDNCIFVSTIAGWIASGSAALVQSGQFLSSLSANAYQRLPSGLITQLGMAVVPASYVGLAATVVTFPNSFPNNVRSVVCTLNGPVTKSGGPSMAIRTSAADKRGFSAAVDLGGIAVYDKVDTPVPFFWTAYGD